MQPQLVCSSAATRAHYLKLLRSNVIFRGESRKRVFLARSLLNAFVKSLPVNLRLGLEICIFQVRISLICVCFWSFVFFSDQGPSRMKLYFCFIFCTFVQCQNAQEPSAATKANVSNLVFEFFFSSKNDAHFQLDEAFTLMAQPIFQEPPPAFSHSSASYWNNPSAYETGAEVCIETHNDFVEARDHLFHVKETLLDRIDCGVSTGNTNCTKVIISSIGKSLVRHPPRFGLYSLETVFEGYPAYTRNASQQSLFYKEEYEKWIYAHKFERWVIGPQIGDENGGFVMLSEEVCPWNIDFDETDMYYYDKLVYNTWNPVGNGWRSENGMIAIECYDSDKYPLYSCGCNVVNVTSDGGRISEYHPQKLGKYLHEYPFSSEELVWYIWFSPVPSRSLSFFPNY